MAAELEKGQVRARDASRVFRLNVVKERSLKEVILRRQLPPKRQLWALRDVDLEVAPGQAFGIVGPNGSGKSTLLKLLAGIFAPSTGTIAVGGRVGSLIEIGAGFHPEFTGVENIYLNAAIYGLKREYIDRHLEEILAFAELESFADVPVRTYSSGMYMRLGFSVAMHIRPDVLLLDEVLAVGDEACQQKCYGKIGDFKRGGGTIVFVSHDPGAVERLCDQAVLLDHGRAVERGSSREVVRAYHRRLVSASHESADGREGRAGGPSRVHEVRAVAGDGVVRERFTEGEPMALEVWLYAEDGLDDARVTLGLRDSGDRTLGTQTVDAVRLRPGRLERLRLHFPGLPLREGRFYVDVGLETGDGDAQLDHAERALELSVFGQDPGGGGAIRLGGTWELPAVDGTGDG